jgi:hypothetical protein
MNEQQDDHIWLTVGGSAWAIREIIRDEAGVMRELLLWRGYEPDIVTMHVGVFNFDVSGYCTAAAAVIEAQLRPLS